MRVPAALAVIALGIAVVEFSACHLRTGPENDAHLRGVDGRGSGDGGVHDGGVMFDARGGDAGFDAGMVDGGATVDAAPDAPPL